MAEVRQKHTGLASTCPATGSQDRLIFLRSVPGLPGHWDKSYGPTQQPPAGRGCQSSLKALRPVHLASWRNYLPSEQVNGLGQNLLATVMTSLATRWRPRGSEFWSLFFLKGQTWADRNYTNYWPKMTPKMTFAPILPSHAYVATLHTQCTKPGTEQVPRNRAFTAEMNHIVSEFTGALLCFGCLLTAVGKPMLRGGHYRRETPSTGLLQ